MSRVTAVAAQAERGPRRREPRSTTATTAGPRSGRRGALLPRRRAPIPRTAPTTTSVPTLFRSHLEWIDEWGLTVVPLAEIVDRHAAGRELDGLVALTFDDALLGVLEHAAPILEAAPRARHRVRRDRRRRRRSAVLARRGPDAAPRRAADAVRVGPGHPRLAHRDARIAPRRRPRHPCRGARATRGRGSRTSTGAPVDLFAYPFGHHDAAERGRDASRPATAPRARSRSGGSRRRHRPPRSRGSASDPSTTGSGSPVSSPRAARAW